MFSFSTDKISAFSALFSTATISPVTFSDATLFSTVITSSISVVSMISDTFSDALTAPIASNEKITIKIIIKA